MEYTANNQKPPPGQASTGEQAFPPGFLGSLAPEAELKACLWRDYDFERNRLYVSGRTVYLTAVQRTAILHQYRSAVKRGGTAPKLGEHIFKYFHK